MSVQEVTMYRVVCDAEGCGVSAQDGGECAAWAEVDGALIEAQDNDWYTATSADPLAVPFTAFCPTHLPRCADEDCGQRLRCNEFGPYCDDHAELSVGVDHDN